MMRFLQYLVTFIILVILQEFVFDNINIAGLVNPYIYIMFIILLPFRIPGWLLLLLGFVSGMVIDLLNGTIGLQAICATWLAFVRPAMVNIFIGKDEVYDGGMPSGPRLGTMRFLRYVVAMVLLFNIPLFLLEDMEAGARIIALRITLSTLLSTAIIYVLHLPSARGPVKI